MTKRQRRADYHHGTLRELCVREGLVQLAKHGKEGVSLRDLARKAGVSPRAPYQHFADKTEFLAALAQEGFRQFGEALLSAQAKLARRSGPGRLLGLAEAYVAFGAAQPALMQLMFGDDFGDRRQFPELDAAALATFELLRAEVAPLLSKRSARDVRLFAATAWLVVHGLSELGRHGQLAHVLPNPKEQRALAAFAVSMLTSAAGGTLVDLRD